MGRRTVYNSDLDWHLIPDMFFGVHFWTHSHVGPDMLTSHVLHMAGHRLAQTQSSIRRLISLMVACGPSESGCSDACSSSHPGWPRCPTRHDGLHPRPWLVSRDFHELPECRHRSASCLDSGAPVPYDHYGIGRRWTRHRRCSVYSDEGPRLGAFGPTHDDVADALKSVVGIWQDPGPDIQQSEVDL